MTKAPDTSATSSTGSWPWPPEIPRPPGPPTEPSRPAPPDPEPILPSWDEPTTPWDRDLTDRLLEQRVVFVNGDLDDALADQVARKLLLLGRHDPDRPVDLHLSCRDSELTAALSVAATIDLAGAPVHATVSGVLSGPVVAALCASAERTAHRHATFVLSVPGDDSARRPDAEIASRAEEHARMVAQVVERVAAVAHRSAGEVAEDLRSGRVLSAEDAADYGLVNELR